MPVTAKDVVAKFATRANNAYKQAFASGDALLAEHEISTPLRLAHLMAQCLHETDACTILIESGDYRENGLGKMWDDGNWHSYFPNRAAMVAMADQCRRDHGVALFNLVYGNRMGNGPPSSGDGWKYRGRGILQTTGRESYRKFGEKCGVPFEADPELVVAAEHALKPALAEWTAKGVNAAADRNDIRTVTRGINGREVGIASRRAWFAKIWPFVAGPPPAANRRQWQVQAALVGLGYDSGNPDGDVGPRTRSAIQGYRADKGLAPGTAIDEPLLRSLGIVRA